MNRFDWLIITNSVGCALGGIVPIVWARRGEPSVVVHGFAAGTLLGTALLVLIPEASSALGAGVGYGVLAGFLILYILDRVLLGAEELHGHGHTEAGHAHHLGALALAGFSVHTVADGAALGVARAVPELELPVLMGVLFHEMPAQYVLSRLLVASGTRRPVIALVVAGLSFLMAASAYATSALPDLLSPSIVPWALAGSAGMFLFISTAELLPRVHEENARRAPAIAAFLAGIGIAIVAHEIGHR